MQFPAEKLVRWFKKNQRNLPWRKNYKPFEVWVSEIMLQQTRVEQMLPYYHRFLEQFPSVTALAVAKEETVLKAWEGLGYYSRARNLHRATQKIVFEKKGRIPQTAEELKELPGFGEYIANAVASIAFNQLVAVVDGNVFRVLGRYFGIHSDIAEAKTKKEFQKIAYQILPKGKAREFNQGLMELGALVCLPQQPLCTQCPLREKCVAKKQRQQNLFPVKTKKPKRPIKTFAAILVQLPEKVWLVKRKQKLLQGLWEFPQVPLQPLSDSKRELEKRFGNEFCVTILLGKEIGRIEHDYTHFHQSIVLFEAAVSEKSGIEWISKTKIKKLPLSKANQKLLKIAGKQSF